MRNEEIGHQMMVDLDIAQPDVQSFRAISS